MSADPLTIGKSIVPVGKKPPKFRELLMIERLIHRAKKFGKVCTEGVVQYRGFDFPIYSFNFGNPAPDAPSIGMVAGVHGLERIGTSILTSYLKTLLELMEWDDTIHKKLENISLHIYPMTNPGGVYWHTRSNPNGVDIMRNAPVDSPNIGKLHVYSGHRISPLLPWYRGKDPGKLEAEAEILCRFVREKVWSKSFSMCIDVHSGFGSVDRIWFPYAKTKAPFPNIAEMVAWKKLFDRTYPNHVYCVEPQSKQYLTHGDIWDYLYDQHREKAPETPFFPIALEIGSWLWVKKNPRQALKLLGVFNPVLPHRKQRTLRRHLPLFDFLLRSTQAHLKWAHPSPSDRAELEQLAHNLWYGKK